MDTVQPNIRLDKEAGELFIIDQTLLPNEEREIACRTEAEMLEAIRSLRIRGAPAIGIFAAYGLYILARSIPETEDFLPCLRQYGDSLKSARPTAVNLAWAVDLMLKTAVARAGEGRAALLEALYEQAAFIHRDDIAKCAAISEYGLSLIRDGDGILTHCNAGALATGGYGTALGVIRAARAQGKVSMVYADETRPLLQGARLTAYELVRDDIPVTLICDDMAGYLMAQGQVDLVIAGCDRMAANGDFANKIGTYSLAVLAKHHGIPFYTALPSSTIDLSIPDGSHIPVEQRSSEEVSCFAGVQTGPVGVQTWNPAFDVTPHELLTAAITERGVLCPPFDQKLACQFV